MPIGDDARTHGILTISEVNFVKDRSKHNDQVSSDISLLVTICLPECDHPLVKGDGNTWCRDRFHVFGRGRVAEKARDEGANAVARYVLLHLQCKHDRRAHLTIEEFNYPS